MAFDWQDYLTFAEEIKSRTDEASKRSAISRAYYCVFHKAKSYAISHLGYVYRPENPSHSGMWIKFKNNGKTLNAIFNYGKKLQDFRETADYHDEFHNIDNYLIQAFQSAETALNYLKKVEGDE